MAFEYGGYVSAPTCRPEKRGTESEDVMTDEEIMQKHYGRVDRDSIEFAAIADARREGMREAAEIARNYDSPHCFDPELSVVTSAADAIARAIEDAKE